MGCAQSKIDNEESVSRCKERRNLMKEAVSVRNAFASAHSGFAVSLKDTGAALSDYAQGEVPPPPPEEVVPSDLPVSERLHPPPPPMESNLPPPPPPLPAFSPMPPLRRAETMPALSHSDNGKRKMKGISVDESDIDEEDEEEEEEENGGFQRRKKREEVRGETPKQTTANPSTPVEMRGMAWDYFFVDNIPEAAMDEVEEEVEDLEDGNENLDAKFNNVADDMEFRTPEKQVKFEGIEEFKTPQETPADVVTEKQFLHSNTAPPAISRIGVTPRNMEGNKSGVDLLKLLSQIDDHFLKASQSAQEVSKMLEATRLHYHSNFADNRGDSIIVMT